MLPIRYILLNFVRHFPVVVAATLGWWLFLTVPIFAICRSLTDLKTARIVGCSLGGIVTLVLLAAIVAYFLRKFSRYEFAITGDHVVMRGISGWRFISKKINVASIADVTLGKSLSVAEKLTQALGQAGVGPRRATKVLTEINASQLIITKGNGTQYKLDFVNHVFESESLLLVINHLVRTGMVVSQNS